MLVIACIPQADGQTARQSLLIGVSAYPPSSGWRKLNAGNDLDLLQEVMAKNGFSVQSLKDEKATRQGILSLLAKYARELPEGAVFHFHFSGHGQQVQDLSGDEFDGLDEVLVPFDAPATYSDHYRGENHLLDDELGQALDAIREKVGPSGQVFVTLDACHAGTATRGLSTCRGTDLVLAPPDFTVNEEAVLQETDMMETSRAVNLAPITVFAASSAQQVNWEYPAADGKQYGPLSFALGKVLANKALDNFSYRAFFDKIKAEMAVIAPRQTPRSEGALNLSFGKNTVRQSDVPHYDVVVVANKTELKINGGLLQNLHEGSLLAFYPPDTWQPEPGKAMVRGRITFAGLTISDIELEKPVDREKLAGAWAYVEEQNLGDARFALGLTLPSNRELEAELRNQLKDYPAVIIDGDGYDLLIEETPEGKIRAVTRDELVIHEDFLYSVFADAAYLTEEVIVKHARSKFLRQLEYEDPFLKVRLEYIPNDSDQAGSHGESSTEDLIIKEGELFYLDVVNEGKKACYISLLDVQPDMNISSLAPGVGSKFQPEDYYLQPGERRRLKNGNSTYEWKASPPFGLDILKLIATEEPIDMRNIIQTRGLIEGSNPVARALGNSFSLRTRGDMPDNLPSGAASVFTLALKIVTTEK